MLDKSYLNGYNDGKNEGKTFSLYMLSNVIKDMKSKDTTPLSIAINAIFDELYQNVADELKHNK